MRLIRAIRAMFWVAYLRLHGAKVGKNLKIGEGFDILLRDGAVLRNLTIGDNVTFMGKVFIRMRNNGKITLANGVTVGTEVWLVTANDSELYIGEDSKVGSYSIFNGGHGIRIGSECIFGGFLYLVSSNHCHRKGEPIRRQGYYGASIEIGDDVWLGGHLTVLSGIKIGTGAVVGAGALVNHDIPEYQIAVGNPAQVIGERE